MKINITNVLALDDNKDYVVVSKANYENKEYFYLAEVGNPKNVIFCYRNDNELTELKDNNLINKLLPIFVENTSKIITVDEIKAILEAQE